MRGLSVAFFASLALSLLGGVSLVAGFVPYSNAPSSPSALFGSRRRYSLPQWKRESSVASPTFGHSETASQMEGGAEIEVSVGRAEVGRFFKKRYAALTAAGLVAALAVAPPTSATVLGVLKVGGSADFLFF
uniref:Uncharacterized protein n=1 Tax=Chromera velia CCMP2878 TaxID=1169474 RepID=A0A0G4I7C0_9ALVE|eukprot:Cvel_25033.t1-p1 / transcript=Cvel_25033.t1 / gene=Cvel_25033 / organism=Chromera_velia_CCMP2878 / gene_product=hypothetical protein / transcript_product=hypothetical protein / location=Cvel_scaffold2778:22742-23746(+) / protein_length=131 / sequence_SO=supercontig / SO=protein_coding / is_pseudo=false